MWIAEELMVSTIALGLLKDDGTKDYKFYCYYNFDEFQRMPQTQMLNETIIGFLKLKFLKL